MSTETIIKTSTAAMPSSCKGRYAHVAILEVEEGALDHEVAIDDRRKAVHGIVQTWESRNVGKTPACAYGRALAEARAAAPGAREIGTLRGF